ncbi:hypothetical protein [Streptomyces sp. NPDC002088]|uniref:hypothetical protein n=1 Tax=Streptomyces sp. NPDC002088 TaxID=3154665 RepID=UPI00332D9DA8
MTNTPLHTSEAPASAPIALSLEETKELLARAVEEKGRDYVYKQVQVDSDGSTLCAYFDPATKCPSCMVGHVLAYKGLTFDRLVNEDGDRNTFASVEALSDLGVISIDNPTLALLTVVQTEQDGGMTWGDAVDEALETYEGRSESYETEGYDAPDWHYGL